MTPSRSPLHSQAVKAVTQALRDVADKDRYPLVARFAPFFLDMASQELLAERSASALAGMCWGTFQFLDRSRPDRVDVEVVTSDGDHPPGKPPVMIVHTNISERPFIVDTIREYLSSLDLATSHLLYPLITVERDAKGRIVGIQAPGKRARTESVVYAEVSEVPDPETREVIRKETARRLADVVRATDDFGLMVDKVGDVVSELGFRLRHVPDRREEFREIQAFLRWLRDGGFVFLGYRAYTLEPSEPGGELAVSVDPGSGLGILQDESGSTFHRPVPLAQLSAAMRDRALSGPLLIISKANAESTVHRRARMDYIGVKKLRSDGSVAGEHRFLGLFTSRAYSEAAQDIPILRHKLASILEMSGAAEGSHDYKEIITIFDSLPKEELFLASVEEIAKDIRTILVRYNTSDVFVSVRRDALDRGVSVMVVLPRNRFSGSFRREFETALIDRYNIELLNYHLAMSAGNQARLHFYLGGAAERLAEIKASDITRTVTSLTRSWMDGVRDLLAHTRSADEARRLARHYARAFAPKYRAATETEAAVRDIEELESMREMGSTESVRFYQRPDSGSELKVYMRHQKIVLSDFMPVLENCGLRVIAVSPFELSEDERGDSAIYSFDVQTSDGSPVDVEKRASALADAILAVRVGDATNDGFNRLVQRTGMAWREVEVLRAYAHYAFQVGSVPTRQVLRIALDHHSHVGLLLFRLFEARFAPAATQDRTASEARARELRRQIGDELVGVSSLAFDRALRALQTAIDATVRTNYYRVGGCLPTRRSGGVPYISLKFDCARLRGGAKSRLKYEIWVRSSRMEGLHLRGALIARGGIRHSDRPDDFRTEVMGLALTQVVKNAVIVPGGSKGGFVCLRSLAGLEDAGHEALEQYRTLIRGLLDITDNLSGEEEGPEGVVRYDGFDPYLVVAADKGTAPFSDAANAVAKEYDFWLDDAFASGGSNGYDHKKVAITARGAWESAKRHFREMGRDIKTEPFTAVGIGDMSGDVFGNGMLLSRHIRLIAAFDHRHVFIDPDPDRDASFAERKRLFDMDRSSWEDYDVNALSTGGMIVPRGAKLVKLTPEASRALGLGPDATQLDGEHLIRAVLAAPVDLLWNGGIGTYVKAGAESHAEVGDASNDPVRIDVSDLHAKVVVEGGNLGFTRAARVEYALSGGRINTDALDNSGGVNLSDREVNLKILLTDALARGLVTREERNRLLDKFTDTVAQAVLADNESGCRAVSLDEYMSRRSMRPYWSLMTDLSRSGLLDRDAEGLPSWDDLTMRKESNQSLTRPELAVLLSYAKLHLKSELLASNLPDDPAAVEYFHNYFPAEAIDLVGRERALRHRLRREIVACQLTNDLLDLMGSTFINRLVRDTGHDPAQVARGWLVAAKLTGHKTLLAQIRKRTRSVSTAVSYRWTMKLTSALERTTRWVLNNSSPDDSTEDLIHASMDGLEELRGRFHDIVAGQDRDHYLSLTQSAAPRAEDEGLVRDLAVLRFLDHLLEILRVARATGTDPVGAAKVYYSVTEELRIPHMVTRIRQAAGSDRWRQRWALGLLQDLGAIRRHLTARVLTDKSSVAQVLDAPDHRGHIARFREVLDELEADQPVGLAGLSVAIQPIRHLAT